MAKNYMPEVAKMLGVEIGEEFGIEQEENDLFIINENGLWNKRNCGRYESILHFLLIGLYTIIKPPKLTPVEKTILDNVDKEYNWIARDRCEILGNIIKVFKNKPRKFVDSENGFNGDGGYWTDEEEYGWFPFKEKFKFIKWEDQEPYNIKELLGE